MSAITGCMPTERAVGEISTKSNRECCAVVEKFKRARSIIQLKKLNPSFGLRVLNQPGKGSLMALKCGYTSPFRLMQTTFPRVKICCISTPDEARLAMSMGASALGLVGAMPSGPGVITDEQIAAITRTVPPPVATFLLTSETNATQIIAHQRRVLTNTIQLVDALQMGQYQQIRDALPGIRLVQVIHVLNEQSVEEALRVAPQVDALLLDSGNPNLTVKELGGTGRVHDWRLSRQIRDTSPVPVFLAGGLRPDNVRQAIDVVQPFGLDLCSGVRTHGHLDPVKLAAFMEAVFSR